MDREKKKILYVFTVVIILFSLVVLWDVYGLKVSDRPYYWPVKSGIISSYIILSLMVFKNKITPQLAFDIFGIIFFFYSFYGLAFLDITYFFSFAEAFAFLWFFYTGSTFRYSLLILPGFIFMILGIQMAPNPSFVKEGHDIKGHLIVAGAIFTFVSIFFYHFLNRQRLLLDSLTDKFAVIGKQSAFLLHELKSPLARLVKKSGEKSQDVDHIFSIVSGIEMLVQKEEIFRAHFVTFEWNEIHHYISDEFAELCTSYKWDLRIEGFEGQGIGAASTIKLALRNLIKNAIESIAQSERQGIIRIQKVTLNGNDKIIISNNGMRIKAEEIKKIFDALYSTKKERSNLGMGLFFVKSVAESHKGQVLAYQQQDETVFEFIIPTETR